jgi:arylsulfatase A-like enzyme
MNLTEEKILAAIQPVIMGINGVRNVFLTTQPEHSSLPSSMIDMMRNSFYPKRSGDIMILYEPYWIGERLKGTTHGSIFSYDTHVPLIWYGWSIKHGSSSSLVHVTDIAPTLADFLQIQEPNGSVGNPIQGLK